MVSDGGSRPVTAESPGPAGTISLAELRERALDQVAAAIAITDADGRIVDWSVGATTLLGWRRDEVLGLTWDDLAGPVAADPDPRRVHLLQAMTDGEGYAGDLTVLTRDGERIPIMLTADPVHADDGTVIGSVAVAVADDRRDSAEERFEIAFRDSPVASVITVAPRQLILDVNPAFEQLSGYPRQDAIGRTSNELDLWESEGAGDALLAMTAVQAAIDGVPVRVRHASGEILEARIHGRPIALADGPAYLWMAVDETDRVRAEEEARALASQLDAIVSAAPMAVAALDAAGDVVLWNPAAELMTGWTATEVLGRPSPIAVPEPETADDLLDAVRHGALPRDATVTIAGKDGRQVRAMVAAAEVESASEHGRSTVIMAADVTEREAMEAIVREAQTMESIGQLAGRIAHDFNNLMTAIAGYSAMAIETLGPDHPVAADLREVTRATERATGLTRQLMAFSRRQVIQPQTIDLAVVVRSSAPALERLLEGGVSLDLSEVSRAPALADAGVVEQVLGNLALNAREAMPHGGVLRITTARTTIDRAAATRIDPAMAPGRYGVLTVSDTGTGMDATTASRAFEPFFTTRPDGVGAGLGLSVVHGLVRQSGGFVSMTTSSGRGTTFRIFMPEATGPAAPGPSAVPRAFAFPAGDGGADVLAHAAEPVPRPAVVLVAEDEPAIRTLATRILERAGHTVVVAEDGQAALDLAATLPVIDVLLTDLTMPRLGGADLARRLTDARPGLPVVYMSGFGEDRLAVDGVLPTRVRLLHKPFDVDTLARAIDEALSVD
jgi:two-component system cell cycle sensor histidine kinase/response regulator CckA